VRRLASLVVWFVFDYRGFDTMGEELLLFAVGGLSLYRQRLPYRAKRGLAQALEPLRAVHSGHVGDYVAWLTFGVAAVGGLLALAIR
jgi:hypothetical protein